MRVEDLDSYVRTTEVPHPFVVAALVDRRAVYPEYRLVAAGGLCSAQLRSYFQDRFRGSQPDRASENGPCALYGPLPPDSVPPENLTFFGASYPLHICADGSLERSALLIARLQGLRPESPLSRNSITLRKALCEMDLRATQVAHSRHYPLRMRSALDSARIQCLYLHRRSIPQHLNVGAPVLPHGDSRS